jgi:hypothetical protein
MQFKHSTGIGLTYQQLMEKVIQMVKIFASLYFFAWVQALLKFVSYKTIHLLRQLLQ